MAVEYGVILTDSIALLRGYDDIESKLEEGLKQYCGLDVKVFGGCLWEYKCIPVVHPDFVLEEGQGPFVWDSSGVSPRD